ECGASAGAAGQVAAVLGGQADLAVEVAVTLQLDQEVSGGARGQLRAAEGVLADRRAVGDLRPARERGAQRRRAAGAGHALVLPGRPRAGAEGPAAAPGGQPRGG